MVETLIYSWFDKAQIDYSHLYMRLYIAYTVWFRQVTKAKIDREGIKLLKDRFVIWADYIDGGALSDLRPVMDRITEANLLVGNEHDWQGLIDFWYEVRCNLFHGQIDPSDAQVRLAYESLNIFMIEVVSRMRRCVTENAIQKDPKLYIGFIDSPDIWNVDMIRA